MSDRKGESAENHHDESAENNDNESTQNNSGHPPITATYG